MPAYVTPWDIVRSGVKVDGIIFEGYSNTGYSGMVLNGPQYGNSNQLPSNSINELWYTEGFPEPIPEGGYPSDRKEWTDKVYTMNAPGIDWVSLDQKVALSWYGPSGRYHGSGNGADTIYHAGSAYCTVPNYYASLGDPPIPSYVGNTIGGAGIVGACVNNGMIIAVIFRRVGVFGSYSTYKDQWFVISRPFTKHIAMGANGKPYWDTEKNSNRQPTESALYDWQVVASYEAQHLATPNNGKVYHNPYVSQIPMMAFNGSGTRGAYVGIFLGDVGNQMFDEGAILNAVRPAILYLNVSVTGVGDERQVSANFETDFNGGVVKFTGYNHSYSAISDSHKIADRSGDWLWTLSGNNYTFVRLYTQEEKDNREYAGFMKQKAGVEADAASWASTPDDTGWSPTPGVNYVLPGQVFVGDGFTIVGPSNLPSSSNPNKPYIQWQPYMQRVGRSSSPVTDIYEENDGIPSGPMATFNPPRTKREYHRYCIQNMRWTPVNEDSEYLESGDTGVVYNSVPYDLLVEPSSFIWTVWRVRSTNTVSSSSENYSGDPLVLAVDYSGDEERRATLQFRQNKPGSGSSESYSGALMWYAFVPAQSQYNWTSAIAGTQTLDTIRKLYEVTKDMPASYSSSTSEAIDFEWEYGDDTGIPTAYRINKYLMLRADSSVGLDWNRVQIRHMDLRYRVVAFRNYTIQPSGQANPSTLIVAKNGVVVGEHTNIAIPNNPDYPNPVDSSYVIWDNVGGSFTGVNFTSYTGGSIFLSTENGSWQTSSDVSGRYNVPLWNIWDTKINAFGNVITHYNEFIMWALEYPSLVGGAKTFCDPVTESFRYIGTPGDSAYVYGLVLGRY